MDVVIRRVLLWQWRNNPPLNRPRMTVYYDKGDRKTWYLYDEHQALMFHQVFDSVQGWTTISRE